MLIRLHRIALAASRLSAQAGALALLAGMLVTVVDIVLRRATGISIPGTVDLIQLFVIAVVFLALPYAFLADGHVSVDLVADRAGPRTRAALKAGGALLGLIVVALLGWYGSRQAMLQAGYGDVSQTIGIPLTLYWLPLLIGFAASAVATALLCLGFAVEALTGRPWPPRDAAP